MQETPDKIITVRDLKKSYPLGDIELPILKGVSFSADRGEMIALMGASGSGKTTLMNILGCLDRPTGGRYWFEGEDVGSLSNDQRARLRNHKIGFVFQNFNLLPRTSALENVTMPLLYRDEKRLKKGGEQHAEALLDLVGLSDRTFHEPSQLSGGQQQRVAIARALVNEPIMLLADEPTGNLDSRTGKEILAVIRRLNRENGITILLVTHDAEVADYADRVIEMQDGVIAQGTQKP